MNDPILQLALDNGLSAESVHLCRMGAFDVPDLVDHLPTLRPLIAQHGETEIVNRCQWARFNCGSGQQAIDAVVAFYAGERGNVARRAMTPAEIMAA